MFGFLALVLVSVTQLQMTHGDSCGRIVCYTTNWSQYRQGTGKFFPDNIDPSLCTHIIYAFAKLSGNHLAAFEWNDDSTDWSVGLYEKFVNLKQRNPALKTMLAVGGWNLGSQPFTQIVQSPSNRQDFISQSITFLRERNFDGLDLDWEYPANRGSPPQDRDHFTELVRELKQAYEQESQASGKPRLLLSAAVAAGKPTIDTAYDIPAISRELDFINLMSYDLHGSWETVTGHNSPLYPASSETGDNRNLNIDFAANYWVQKGAARDKLNIGMGLYGRSFTLASASNYQLGAPAPRAGTAGEYTREAGFISYYEVCNMQKSGGQVERIQEQMVPFIHKNDQWVGYDDPESLRNKVRYVKEHQFGGVMVWALPLDDFNGATCGSGPYPLMHAINAECGQTTGTLQTPAPVQTTHGPIVTERPPVTDTPHTTQHPGIDQTDRFNCNGHTDGFYASPGSCLEYYICAGQITYAARCADGLVFNANTFYCDWPANFHCTLGDAPPPTSSPVQHQTTTRAPSGNTQTPSNIDINNFCANQPDGIHPDPTDCAYFFECANGATFREICAPGTVWNPNLSLCDFPSAVPSCNHVA